MVSPGGSRTATLLLPQKPDRPRNSLAEFGLRLFGGDRDPQPRGPDWKSCPHHGPRSRNGRGRRDGVQNPDVDDWPLRRRHQPCEREQRTPRAGSGAGDSAADPEHVHHAGGGHAAIDRSLENVRCRLEPGFRLLVWPWHQGIP